MGPGKTYINPVILFLAFPVYCCSFFLKASHFHFIGKHFFDFPESFRSKMKITLLFVASMLLVASLQVSAGKLVDSKIDKLVEASTDKGMCRIVCTVMKDPSPTCQKACETGDDTYKPMQDMSEEQMCTGICQYFETPGKECIDECLKDD